MWLDIRGGQDSNGDGIGDLPGLISRLDHFQEIGVGALVFPGLQPSDWSYVGTMMTEFCGVDPRYGTLADFDRLIEAAHARGIAILLGWSPFSTHPDHPHFAASRDPQHPKHAEFRDYFLWADDINTRQPRRWGHWRWDPLRRAYHHTVWKCTDGRWCPEVNLLSERARRENEKVVRFWLERGADGFWVDCGVWGSFVTLEDHVAFSRELTGLVHSYPNKWIICEGSKSLQDTIERDGYDSFFNSFARSIPIQKTVFRRPGVGTLVEFFEGLESHGIHEALYSFYDDPRGNQVMNVLFETKAPLDFGDPADLARFKLQFAIHATLPLIPLIRFPLHCGLDRLKRRESVNFYPFLMMWDDSPNYGFTSGTPYIPQNVEGYPPSATVEAQLRDPESILSAFKTLMNLRRDTPALQARDPVAESYARIPTDDDDNCFAYVRRHVASRQAMVIVTNLLGEPKRYGLRPARSGRAMAMLGGRRALAHRAGAGTDPIVLDRQNEATVELPAHGFAVLEAR
jgi:glycosidase